MPPPERGSVEASPATLQRVGVLGGGQLGKMLGIEAARMGIRLKVLDPNPNCPAASVAEQVLGDFSDRDTVRNFVTDEDVLTVEIEHVDATALKAVAEATDVDVEPTPATLALIQDKFLQKEHFNSNGIKVTSFMEIVDQSTCDLAVMALGFPLMLKSRRLAYDGRGNAVVKAWGDLESALNALGGVNHGLYAEKWAPFSKELAVMVARSRDGTIKSFPVTETVHKNSICYVTQTPANIAEDLWQKAREMAEKAVGCLEGAGIFGVEMFVVGDPEQQELMLNEVAPRPHNSGHYTIEACAVSQFEQHLRAVLGLPLGDATLKVGSSVMLNILGESDGEEGATAARVLLDKAYQTPGATVHWYGKKGVSKNRKVGHVTIVAADSAEAISRLAAIEPEAAAALERSSSATTSGTSDSAAGTGEKVYPGRSKKASRGSVTASAASKDREAGVMSMHRIGGTSRISFVGAMAVEAEESEPSTSGSAAEVAVIMGSDSDLATMKAAAEVLEQFGVRSEVTVVSAHRTPERMLGFAREAHKRGIKVIIAGAGGAAHLPGMVAALTPLPVIGVPVTPSGAHLDGLDALMSIVQMPRGVPVATVAIGNAENAGLLAVRILAASRPALLERMLAYQEEMRTTVLEKAKRLEQNGWRDY